MNRSPSRTLSGLVTLASVVVSMSMYPAAAQSSGEDPARETKTGADLRKLNCGNLVYAENQTSICLADAFLDVTKADTTLDVAPKFVRVPLGSPNLFKFPFCIFSGEGGFTLTKTQRENLRQYILQGGFILASPGCSDDAWDRAFRREFKLCFPDYTLESIPMSHPIFSLVFELDTLHDKKGNKVLVEGMIVDERMALVYSHEGLNDVGNAEGCCCCGGNEIREAQKVNVNIITYSLLH